MSWENYFITKICTQVIIATLFIIAKNWWQPRYPLIGEWMNYYTSIQGFSGHATGKESTFQCRRCKRCRFDPWVGKVPWNGKWHPTQYSCLEYSMGRGAWQAIVHRPQFMGPQRVRHDWATEHKHTYTHTHT